MLWKVILIWSAISIFILSATHDWSEVIFTVTFGFLYGGMVYHNSQKIGDFSESSGLKNFPVYIAVCLLVSVVEELYVYSLGNRIAVPIIWKDLVIVPGEWLVWFAAWYLIIARKFAFSYGEVLFLSGFGGIMFEFLGNGLAITNIVGFIITFPLTIVVYAAIFILPMQFINFSGQSHSFWKYPASIIIPYVLTIPVTILLYALV